MLLATVTAQDVVAGELNLQDIVSGFYKGESLSRVTPLADGDTYAQISKNGKQIVAYSFKTGEQTAVLFDADKARDIKIDKVEGYIISPDGRNILIQTETKAIYRRSFTAEYYIYNVRNNRMARLSNNGPQQTPLFSPDGTMIAFARENNIFLVKLLFENAESQITKDGKRNEIINGIPDWVYEEEFATNCSMVFSADSRQLCWVRYDESKVKEYSMQFFRGIKPEKTEYADYPGLYTYKYPIAGEVNSTVSVHTFDIKSRQTRNIDLPLGEGDYIPRIAATDDAQKIAIFTLNRHQDKLSIYMANPLSTVCKLSIQDNVDKYIEGEHINGVKIAGNTILMPSERSGFCHLYLYNLNGQLLRQVTKGNYEVTDIYGYDEATGNTYYASNEKSALENHVYVTDKNGKTTLLTPTAGTNNATFSKNYNYFINIWSDINTPNVYTLVNNKGKTLATLIDNKMQKEKINNVAKSKRELFSFTTSEGVKLNGWMIKPANFDASKRYPVIMYQYGGPGSQEVTNSWGVGMLGNGGLFEQYLAQEGFIAVCVDNRGTGGRGCEFEKCTYMRLGELESRDQVEAALWLGQQPYVDKDRIGIWGWSYGGWNTLMSMSEGRAVFRAGVAVAPVTSWRYYDSVYTERYMRTPKENAAGYDEVNPMARAKNLNGSLLIVHGLADDNVHFRNTAEYTEALVQADKDFRQLTYTNRNHSIFGGNTRHHLFRQIVNHFKSEMK